LILVACPQANSGGVVLTLQLDHTVIDDGTTLLGNISFSTVNTVDVGAAALSLSSSIGDLTPLKSTLTEGEILQVTYSCDLATHHDCLGQAVITGVLDTATNEHAVATTTVQVLEPDDGSVRDFDGGLCAVGLTEPGPAASCCFDPHTNDAPGCGWVQAQPEVPFTVPLVTADGGQAFTQVVFSIPAFSTCSGHPTVHGGDGGVLGWSCRGYGVDVTGAWQMLIERSCSDADDFLAQQVCPRLNAGGFVNAAYVMTNLALPGVGAAAPTTGAFLVFQP
jgi:hypothetical protein